MKRFPFVTSLVLLSLLLSSISTLGLNTPKTAIAQSNLPSPARSIQAEDAETMGASGTFVDTGQSLGSWSSWRVALGDLDGDNDLDAFTANALASNKVWINDGSGNFTDNGHNMGNTPSFNVALGDLDGDGDLDAFVVDSSDVNRVWVNDATGHFSLKQNVSGSASRSDCVALGDLDGDGDLDAFISNHNQPNEVWLNNGTGFFDDSVQRLGDNGHSSAVALGDLDGDGDLDAFVGNIDRFANKVWLNNGTGVFSDSGQSLGNSSSRDVALGDLDNDGDLDAFIANWEGGANKVWLNNGSGSFADSGQDAVGISSAGIALGDVDGDGDLDAFVAHYSDQPNTVWLNDGTGLFSDSGQSLGASRSTGVALGDLDGDGDLDAFVANHNNQGNRVWLNQSRNTPPTADVGGPYGGGEGSAIPLDKATASDPDEDALTYAWSVDAPALCSFSDATALNPNLTCADNGSFIATLTVSDGVNDPVSSDATVTVANVAPTATFGDNGPVDEGSSFTLSLSGASDPSTVDTAAGFEFAFDCGDGSGYGAFSTSSSVVCPTDDNGTRSVGGKIKDKDGGVSEYNASVTVNNVAPTPSISGPTTGQEGTLVALTGSATDPAGANDAISLAWSVTKDSVAFATGTGSAIEFTPDDNAEYVVTLTASDEDGGAKNTTHSVTLSNVDPQVSITGPDAYSLVAAGNSITFEGSFTDVGTADTHTAVWTFDAATIDPPDELPGTVTQGNGSGTVRDPASFDTPGVYRVTLTVTDDDGGVGQANLVDLEEQEAWIVVYDPSGGFVTGGGWINSPTEACPDFCGGATGKANFGFVSKYKKGASTPSGQTEFQFKAGDLNFHSSSYDWLVVAGANAKYKGMGTINGEGAYKFMLTATDAEVNDDDAHQVDLFRIKIWYEEGDNEIVVYDIQMGADDDGYAGTEIGGGNIKVHKAK